MSDTDSLNQTVWEGEVDGTVYEVDFLTDSGFGHGWTYHVFLGASAVQVGGDVQRDHHEQLGDREYLEIVRDAIRQAADQ